MLPGVRRHGLSIQDVSERLLGQRAVSHDAPTREDERRFLPLNDGFTSVNNTDDLTNLPEPGDPTQNIGLSIRYDGAMSRSGLGGPTYDQNLNRACLCDSSWPVGLGPGERQQAEFHGPDCGQKRCPTGDDPMTERDETNCTGVVAAGGRGVGRPGNICHVDCSNRGTCKDGLCKWPAASTAASGRRGTNLLV